MARRAAAGVGERLAVGDEVDGGQRDVDRGARGLPGAGADQRHRVVGEEPGRAQTRGRDGARAARQPRVREDVRDDAVLAGSSGRPAAAQSSQAVRRNSTSRRIVHREQRRVVVRLGRDLGRAESSAARIASARAGTSVAGVARPTQISAPGSCRRQSSLQTNGIGIRAAPCQSAA